MKKVIEFLKWPLLFPVWVMIGLYLFWLFTVPMESSSYDDNWVSFRAGWTLLGVYFIATILMRISFSRWWAAVITLLFSAYPAFMSLFFMAILGDAQLAALFLTGTILLLLYPVKEILREKVEKNRGMIFLFFVVTFFLLGGNVLYFVSFYPTTILEEKFNGDRYIVTRARDLERFTSYYTFYKCAEWNLSCDELYSTLWSNAPERIIVDEQKGEVSLFSNVFRPTLVYTYGVNSRSYDRYSTIEFEGDVYLISEAREIPDDCLPEDEWSCDVYVYTPYKCNSEYKSCEPLPVLYTDQYGASVFWEENDVGNGVALYDGYRDDGGTLILSYEENPQCFVEGCEILE